MSDAQLTDIYAQIIALLDAENAEYRVIEHAPEGRTDVVSQMRQHPLNQAVKTIVVMVKIGKKTSRYFLANIPGDCQLDLEAVKALVDGTRVMFAPLDRAEALTGCATGAIPPFSFHERLEVLADPLLLQHKEIAFNAGRLDRSIMMTSDSYRRIASPRLESITK